MALLSLQEVSIRFGGPWLLEGATLNIERGERVCLLGRNGEGKSTLLRLAAGHLASDAGEVVRARDLSVAMMPQVVPADLAGTVLDVVGRGVREQPDAWHREAQARKVISQMGLEAAADCATLSGGMKRRVLIAKALSHEPRVLFLDEPTAGVDVELRHAMWELVRELRASGVTIILTTHYIDEAEQMADRIGVINRGELILVEEKEALMKKLGRKQLTLQLREPLDAVPESLARYGLVLSVDGRELVYTYDRNRDHEGMATLLADLDAAGILIEDLHTTQSSLEDIFVNLLRNDS